MSAPPGIAKTRSFMLGPTRLLISCDPAMNRDEISRAVKYLEKTQDGVGTGRVGIIKCTAGIRTGRSLWLDYHDLGGRLEIVLSVTRSLHAASRAPAAKRDFCYCSVTPGRVRELAGPDTLDDPGAGA